MRHALFAMAAAVAAAPAHAQPQAFPAPVVTMVVPTSAGTSSDIVARALSTRLSGKWNNSVVVDNKTGASGSIGIGYAGKAAPDGNTILIVTNTISMLGAINKNLPWTPGDFAPVALMGRTVTALVVNADLPVSNVKELVALAQSKPGQINYATPGVGTPHHLYTELFKLITKTDIAHVPYKATAGATVDIAGGRAQVGFFPLNSVMSLVNAKKIKILATAGDERTPQAPDAPTFKEAGIADVHASSWIGIFVPKNTPQAVVDRLDRDIRSVMADKTFQEELQRQEVAPNTKLGGPAELGSLLASDIARWKDVVEKAGITEQ
ncbi:Tripartite tricarboxylate transporter family receptor [Pigmentiphaga humi]|uniref:Tripartite tricarboxylate transporter family receptor n=1 Tax=Pigmentiphaga humi TaxID=2478468 RepID=A0A3P4B7R3_9BURK|nr:tripartite tricarboxylate transporter substrate-binding protein [Pigmentiphaga humi]VCU72323.1 Tripartite tricarboxylate transporter family receptor [Pigmentiphaga humi]